MKTIPTGFKTAYSLIEILVVVAIVAVLLALLSPVLGSYISRAQSVVCVGNLRQIGITAKMYSSENSGVMPPVNSGGVMFQEAIAPYLKMDVDLRSSTNSRKDLGILLCPTDHSMIPSAFRSYAINYYAGLIPRDQTSQSVSRWTQIVNPKEKIYLIDGFRNTTIPDAAARIALSSTGFVSADNGIGVQFRHGNHANALWLDLHISPVRPEDLLNHGAELLYLRK
ncbi:MAG: prepilin-type N-terminal cleavage/methylation domain-containing protein [Chthoniobacterales bacterium]